MHICTFQDMFQQKMEEPIPDRLVIAVIHKIICKYGTEALKACLSLLKAFALTKQYRWHKLVESCKVACGKGTNLMKRFEIFWSKVKEQLPVDVEKIRSEDVFELLNDFIKCASVRGIAIEIRAETVKKIWDVYRLEILNTINIVSYANKPNTTEEYFVSFKSHFAT